MATTALCNSFKVELLQAGHCFNGPITSLSCSNTSGSNSLTGISSTAGVAQGASVTGTGVPANTTIASVSSSASLALSQNTTANVSSVNITSDVFKFALIKVSPSLTYGATQTNYGSGSGTPTTSNIGTDEATGTGYTAGGIALTNVTPALSSTTATTSFSPSPSLTSATISVTAGIVYNTTTRLGAAAAPLNNRTVGVYDFGGTQTVTNGTMTFTMPVNAAGTALIQLN